MPNDQKFTPSRRWFNTAIVATAAVAAVPTAAASALAPASAFAIDSAPGVNVAVTAGNAFTLTVTDRDSNELERHNGVTASSIHRLSSAHFNVSRIQPPS